MKERRIKYQYIDIDEKGLKHKWIAQQLGMRANALSYALNGHRKLTAQTLVQLCDILALGIKEVLGQDDKTA